MRSKPLLSDAVLFYIHAGLFAFSETIFLFSLPVLFWDKGFPLWFIFGFYALAALPGYFFTARIVRLITKIGIKSMFLFGIFLYILLGFASPLVEANNLWWVLVFFLLSLQAICYFPARALYFSEIISRETVGTQSGVLNAVMLLSRTAAPIIAGVIAVSTKFNSVFVFGAAVMILSAVPVLFICAQAKTTFDLVDYKRMLNHRVFQSTKWAYIADGAEGIITFLLWPLLFYLFLSNNNYFELSSLMTVTCGVSALVMILVGKLFDRKHRKALLGASVFANIVAILGRFALLIFHPVLFVYAVQSFYAVSESMLGSSFESYRYSYSKATDNTFFTIHRDVNFSLGRFLIGSVLALASLFFTDAKGLWPLFLLSIPIVLVYLKKWKDDDFLNK